MEITVNKSTWSRVKHLVTLLDNRSTVDRLCSLSCFISYFIVEMDKINIQKRKEGSAYYVEVISSTLSHLTC